MQIGSGTSWNAVAAGFSHTVAIKSDGTLWAWGDNGFGQLEDGTAPVDKTSPVQIGTDNKWVSVSAGDYHTIALKSDGTLWAWGRNDVAQLGDGTYVDKTTPVQIGSGTTWMAVAARSSHTVAIKSGGTLWAWGYNFYGQLGDGTTVNKSSPVQIGSGTNGTTIATGGAHTVALKSDGTLWAWGNNGYGQLGDCTTTNRTSPVQITGSCPDTTPPTGTISINSGASSTTTDEVTLDLACTDASGCSWMRFSDDGIAWGNWREYTAAWPYTLPSGSGTKTVVYVQFEDGAGNQSGTYQDDITLADQSLYMAWVDNPDGDNEIYLKKSADGGINWMTQQITKNTSNSANASIK